MDKDIADLVEQMSNILSFVEDTDSLEAKLKNFATCIRSVLQTIKDCSESIHKYLGAGTAGENNFGVNFYRC